MRNYKELLLLTLDNIEGIMDAGYSSGICWTIEVMCHYHKIISYEEKVYFDCWLQDNLPWDEDADNLYCWPIGAIEPRIQWLQEQIKLANK